MIVLRVRDKYHQPARESYSVQEIEIVENEPISCNIRFASFYLDNSFINKSYLDARVTVEEKL